MITPGHLATLIVAKAICDGGQQQLQTEAVPGPSGSTLSRSRGKLDILAMFCRRWMWKMSGFTPFWISLCATLSYAVMMHHSTATV
jgi:hypothetical protein